MLYKRVSTRRLLWYQRRGRRRGVRIMAGVHRRSVAKDSRVTTPAKGVRLE